MCIEEHPWVGEAISQRIDSLSIEGHQDGKRNLVLDSPDLPREYHNYMVGFVRKSSGHTS
jgi:hypothetical protein